MPDTGVLALLNFTHLVSTAGYAAIFVLCVLQSCCVPTSSELTMGFAGALAAQGKLSLAGVVVVGALGEVIGAYIAWAVGRYAGRAAVDRFGRYVLLSHHDLDRAEAWYDRHQRFGVFGSRLLPVIRNFVALPAGIAEVPLVRFGVLTAAGSLLWDGAWAGIGYGVGVHWHTIAKAFSDIGYVLAVVAVGVIAVAVYHRYRNYIQATAAEDVQGAGADPGGGRPAGGGLVGGGLGRGRLGAGGLGRGRLGADSLGRGRPGADSPGRGGPGRGVPSAPRPNGSGGRHRAPAYADLGNVRWLSSSSGRPPPAPARSVAAGQDDRWLASSSGRQLTRVRHNEFPNSPIAAWEAAVVRGRRDSGVRVEDLLEEGGEGVEANGRLTAMLGALLLVLLAIEGITILRISPLLTIHVVVGMVLVPVIVLKIGSTGWRFAKYYLGAPEYRRKGPPPPLLRLLGPFVVVSTIAVVASGIATLLVTATPLRNELLLVHKVTFVLWFLAMVVHVLGHLLDVASLAPRDFYRRTRGQVRGASKRQWAIVSAVCVGILLAIVVAPKVGPWLAGYHKTPKAAHAHALLVPSADQHRP
ncbi:MAG: DedA family protein [Actinomycetota bacterium]|nr:DedA family protein [Actinomycetota bacterium]